MLDSIFLSTIYTSLLIYHIKLKIDHTHKNNHIHRSNYTHRNNHVHKNNHTHRNNLLKNIISYTYIIFLISNIIYLIYNIKDIKNIRIINVLLKSISILSIVYIYNIINKRDNHSYNDNNLDNSLDNNLYNDNLNRYNDHNKEYNIDVDNNTNQTHNNHNQIHNNNNNQTHNTNNINNMITDILISYSVIRLLIISIILYYFKEYKSLSIIIYNSMNISESIFIYIIIYNMYFYGYKHIDNNTNIRRLLFIDNITRGIIYNIKYILLYNTIDVIINIYYIYCVYNYGYNNTYNIYNIYNIHNIYNDIITLLYGCNVILVNVIISNIIKYKDNIIIDILCNRYKHVIDIDKG